jgi:hypothetical protein
MSGKPVPRRSTRPKLASANEVAGSSLFRYKDSEKTFRRYLEPLLRPTVMKMMSAGLAISPAYRLPSQVNIAITRVLQNSIWMRSRCAAVFVSSAKPGCRHPGTITALGLLASVQSCFSKLLLRQYTHPKSLPAVACTPFLTVLFPYNVRGRLRPTVE